MSQGLQPSFHAVCQTDDVPEDFGLKAVVGGRAIAVFRVGGSFYAIDDTCTHGQASLSQGYVEGEEVECPLHQGRFHIPTGRPACPPVTEPVRSYPVSVLDGRVYVEVSGG